MTATPTAETTCAAVFRRLRPMRALAAAVLLSERVWPAMWPPLGVLGTFLCAALLNLPADLPAPLQMLLLAATGVAAATLLARGLGRVRLPTPDEADRRLELDSGLGNRPLAVLCDRPALPEWEAAWALHVARTVARLTRLRVGMPRPGLAARDPRALRGLLAVALAACLVIAGPDARVRLRRSVLPAWPQAALPVTEVQAWITPPAYTGLPPVFLARTGGTARVPKGSHLTVNVTGGGAAAPPILVQGAASRPFKALDRDSFQADADLNAGGRLAVRRGGQDPDLAGWHVAVIPGRAPAVLWPSPPGAVGGTGRMAQARLPWQVSHDYGVASLTAELRLRDRPDARPMLLPIRLPGNPKSARGAWVQDLTAHPWAGLAVAATLVARDAAGLAGTSSTESFVLPERRFQNPLAQALANVRRHLALKPDDRLAAVQELDGMSAIPTVWDNDAGGFINLRSATFQLLYGRGAPEARDEVQARLWDLAVHAEEGATGNTALALDHARQALRELVDAQRRGEKTDPDELGRRMKDVLDALQSHLQALAREALGNPDSWISAPGAQTLDGRDMERLAGEMLGAAREGRTDEARGKLAELEKMLDMLKTIHPHRMTGQERERAAQIRRGQEQLGVLQDILRRTGTLLDHAERRAPPVAPPGVPVPAVTGNAGQPGAPPVTPTGAAPSGPPPVPAAPGGQQ
jgi:uncharacterized protein (TIGR02302 family)